jgi:hypothetical protein
MRWDWARSLAAAAALALLAGCTTHRESPEGGDRARCDKEWHPPVEMLLRYADTDGKVTRAAMEVGLKKDFAAADTNHDGVLEPDEARAVNEKRWSEDQAATSPLVDWTHKGYVDFDDFAGTARSLFDQLDADGKGVLAAKQLKALQCGPHRQGGGGEEQQEHPRGGHRGGGRGGPGGGDDGGDPGQ